MTIEDRTLYKDKYLAIKERTTDLNPDNPHTYLFEQRCNGKLVVILPFRRNEKNELEFMIRKERVIIWDPENDVTESVTGGVEEDNPDKTAEMELEEETGYKMPIVKFIPVGVTKIAKHADTDVYMYAIDLTNIERNQDYGDGSDAENWSFSYWASNIGEVESTIIYKIIYRLFEMGVIDPVEYFGRLEKQKQPANMPVVPLNIPQIKL